ncbi:MAG: 3-deoxy-7-phosphoheptulonate synthase [Acidimicrobiia bacterium]
MLIVMQPNATDEDVRSVVAKLKSIGAEAHVSKGKFRTVVGAIGDDTEIATLPLEALDGVERVIPVLKPYKIVAKEAQDGLTIVEIGTAKIGGEHFAVVAGPCAVENREQTLTSAKAVAASGATILRGEAFKPRTSPYAFQGLGKEALEIMKDASRDTGLPFVAEVLDARDVELVAEYADALRVGARNMQNFTLLSEVGKQHKPVILKRGMNSTIEEWLLAAEYIAKEGNESIVLCERGIRTYEPATRFTLDISAVPVLRQLTHLPIIVDPSHAAGRSYAVGPLARAAIAVGADGVMIDVHPCPEEALCDGAQAILPHEFERLMGELRQIARVMGRVIG